MANSIEDIVDHSIALTRRLVSEGKQDWATAREAFKRIVFDLESRAPGHPALARLRRFIDEPAPAARPPQGPASPAIDDTPASDWKAAPEEDGQT